MKALRVLTVDDSPLVRRIIRGTLGGNPRFGAVEEAGGVCEARALLAMTRPDVIVLDIAMPGLSGLEYLDELRGTDHPPVVMLSTSTTPGSPVVEDALARGAAACFDKSRLVADADSFTALLLSIVRGGRIDHLAA